MFEPLDAISVAPTGDHGGNEQGGHYPSGKTTAGTSSPAFSTANSTVGAVSLARRRRKIRFFKWLYLKNLLTFLQTFFLFCSAWVLVTLIIFSAF